jgi:site-specific recombinase XerD
MTNEPAGADEEDLGALTLPGRSYGADTREKYGRTWLLFREWCDAHGRCPLPADSETLTRYAISLAKQELSPNTITTRISAIRTIHRDPTIAGLRKPAKPHPVPDGRMAADQARAYRATIAAAGWHERQMDPLLKQHLKKIREQIPFAKPIGVRDWGMIMLGFALGARRSELARLDIGDLRLDEPHWLLVRLHNGKIVEIRRGVDHTLCAVAAVLDWVAWLRMRNITDGPLFRALQGHGTKLTVHGLSQTTDARAGRLTPQACARVVQRHVRRARLELHNVAGHSLRLGGATSARMAGATAQEIADHFRWHNNPDTLAGHIDQLAARAHNPMAKVL